MGVIRIGMPAGRRDFRSLPSNVLAFIFVYLLKPQIVVLALSVIAFPISYLFYQIPKVLIDDIIDSKSGTFEILGTSIPIIEALWLMGGVYLLLILFNRGLSFAIDVIRARMTVTTSRMLRGVLYRRFHTASHLPTSGEKIPIVSEETDSLSDFVGKAITVPVFQGGQLLIILGFLAAQNIVMALVVLPYMLVVILAIPPLQQRVNSYVRRRLLLLRHVAMSLVHPSERAGDGTENAGYGPLRSTYSNFKMLYRLDFIGAVWAALIDLVKGVGARFNYWCILVVGGYLTITGEISLGTMIAAAAASRDLNAPFSYLVNYYRSFSEAQTRYRQITRRFEEPAGALFVPA